MQFSIVIANVATMLAYILCGFLIIKGRKGETAHAHTVAGILVYVCGPSMILSAFQNMEYSLRDLGRMGLFFLVTLAVQLVMVGALYLPLHRRYHDARYRLLTIAAVMGNVGFLGLPLAVALFPGEPIVACYSTIYSLSMNLIMFTVGVYLLTEDKRYISLRAAILNPTTLSIALALPLYLLRVRLPGRMLDVVALLGRMTTPLCMFILGIRLAGANLGKLIRQPFAYVGSGLKLIVFPLLAYLCVYFIPGLDGAFKACVLVMSAMPSASLILSMAELHRTEQETSANILLISTLLSVITIPLVLSIL